MANTEQIEHWDGPGGDKWVELAAEYDRLNHAYGERIVERLAPRAGERVLDIGCGNGALSLAIAPQVAEVVGLDISGPMLANAARRAADAGLDNVRFEKGDAQVHALPDASFDAAVSRFGVMFFDDTAAAFANVARMLRPGGRFVFTCWQQLFANEWLMVPAAAALAHVPMPELGPPDAPGPFALADADRLRSLLDGAGFTDVAIDEAPASLPLGDSVDAAVTFLSRTEIANVMLQNVDDATVQRVWDSVREALTPHLGPDGVRLGGAAWLVHARR